jgi:AcrR family transcriptional regulator
MAHKTDLAEEILEKAGELFGENGYAATTIKQIAKAAGCTNAALYYYYQGGKAEILRKVIQKYRSRAVFLDDLDESQSISDFIMNLSSSLSQTLPSMADQIGWILLQFPNLPDKEKEIMQEGILKNHSSMTRALTPFTKGQEEAEKIAWLIYTMFYGYQQLFLRAEIERVTGMDIESYGELVVELMDNYLST